jgi:tripartite-type tricarboxylate transporter receptor subunit TctC
MKFPRRTFLHLAAGAAALPAVSLVARAQSYPARPVRLILGYAPGNAPDIVARLMGQWLSERLGQQFIIENRTGAGAFGVRRAGAATGRPTLPDVTTAKPSQRDASLTSSTSISSATLPQRPHHSAPNLVTVNPSLPVRLLRNSSPMPKPTGKTEPWCAERRHNPTSGELFKMSVANIVHVPYPIKTQW